MSVRQPVIYLCTKVLCRVIEYEVYFTYDCPACNNVGDPK